MLVCASVVSPDVQWVTEWCVHVAIILLCLSTRFRIGIFYTRSTTTIRLINWVGGNLGSHDVTSCKDPRGTLSALPRVPPQVPLGESELPRERRGSGWRLRGATTDFKIIAKDFNNTIRPWPRMTTPQKVLLSSCRVTHTSCSQHEQHVLAAMPYSVLADETESHAIQAK